MKKIELSRFLTFVFSAINKPSNLNVNKVEDLDYLIKGYTQAIHDKQILNTLSQFRDFVNKDMESKTNHNWVQLIRLYSANDELSVRLFEEMFKRFLVTININLPFETIQK
ncbi:hypothetical protein SF1_18920 [Sphingobacterium faecium NBRC 15299]|uniref:hypothetical protein n=1 Tax=Sphingobacterium faecium TaxID=34087 RepID=UPI000D34EDA7|nr:hypothetical protein [Sphingobacterium faecium]PTX09467.1 hypothetical protein C8N37_10695 [Sphingobacterium faecium]GEM63910.1 hypothetical protein SF1_18920 [Sphingobacterium faecium NBRC 15299]